MTGKELYEEFLQQLPHNGVANLQFPRRYLLPTTQEVVIGRDLTAKLS